MLFIFKYFFFIAVIVGIINGLIFKSKISNLVKSNIELKDESERIVKGYTISLTLPFLLLGTIQLISGYEDPFFIFSTNYNNTYIVLSWLVLFASWGLLFYWVYFKNGARIIAKYNIINGMNAENETVFKIYIGLMLLGGIVGVIVGSLMNISRIVPLK